MWLDETQLNNDLKIKTYCNISNIKLDQFRSGTSHLFRFSGRWLHATGDSNLKPQYIFHVFGHSQFYLEIRETEFSVFPDRLVLINMEILQV